VAAMEPRGGRRAQAYCTYSPPPDMEGQRGGGGGVRPHGAAACMIKSDTARGDGGRAPSNQMRPRKEAARAWRYLAMYKQHRRNNNK
jgi:hypothetical protein